MIPKSALKKTLSNQPLTRCASFRGYTALVRKLGGCPETLLQTIGLDDQSIADEDLMIPTYLLCDALEIASTTLHAPDFALQLISYQDFDTLGLLALILQRSSSLEELLNKVMTLPHKMHDHGSSITGHFQGKDLYLHCEQSIPQASGVNQRLFLVLGFIAKVARELISPCPTAKAVYFRCKQPKDTHLFEAIFNTRIYFEQEFDGAVIDLSVFQEKHDIVTIIKNTSKPSSLNSTANKNISLSQQLGLLITSGVSLGQTGLTRYAEHLQLSVRSLQRKLKQENTTFSEVLDYVRKDLASRYIQQGRLNMAQITEVLAFSDQATLTRAFQRWYGCAPTEYTGTLL